MTKPIRAFCDELEEESQALLMISIAFLPEGRCPANICAPRAISGLFFPSAALSCILSCNITWDPADCRCGSHRLKVGVWI